MRRNAIDAKHSLIEHKVIMKAQRAGRMLSTGCMGVLGCESVCESKKDPNMINMLMFDICCCSCLETLVEW